MNSLKRFWRFMGDDRVQLIVSGAAMSGALSTHSPAISCVLAFLSWRMIAIAWPKLGVDYEISKS